MARKCTLFTIEIESKIAHEVEKRPILSDVKSSLYKRADLKQAVWDEVAKTLGPPFTGPAVSTRFKNMKDTFMNNHRKVREFKNKCSGSGAEDVLKPKWPLYGALKFLEKSCVQASSQSNISSSDSENVNATLSCTPSTSDGDILSPLQKDMQSTVKNVYYDFNVNRFMFIPNDTSDSTCEVNNDDLSLFECSIIGSVQEEEMSPTSPLAPVPPHRPSSAPVCSTSTPKSKRSGPNEEKNDEPLYNKKGSKKQKAESLMTEAVSVLKEVCKQPETSHTTDHEEVFALYIASRLRAMEPEKRRKCEDAIMQVIMQY